MSNFNLLDEHWISVMEISSGEQKEISMKELFKNAGSYKCLAGDMKTQDFAVLRFLLSIVQTVFSRFDADGKQYSFVELDDRFRQINDIDIDDEDITDEYDETMECTWKNLWENGRFPDVVCDYLEKWRDHFYLIDDEFPFYQLPEECISKKLEAGKKPSPFMGRNINRTISESGNKTALFSPRFGNKKKSNKDTMTKSELTRWLIMFQGYVGTSDKTTFDKKRTSSKGWLYDIGGVYLEGRNLYETLVLNFIPVLEKQYQYRIQKPIWEIAESTDELLNYIISASPVDNLAELYTNWSRAVVVEFNDVSDNNDYITPVCGIVKLPEINHINFFLEPMTIWGLVEKNNGDMKPKKHKPEQAIWRSFGLISISTSVDNKQHMPGIMESFANRVKNICGNRNITINSVSMRDNGQAASWDPVDEIVDSLYINDIVVTDDSDNGWVNRINDSIELTKTEIGFYYKNFIKDIALIRGMDNKAIQKFSESESEMAYNYIDNPFRQWLESIDPEDSKEKKVSEWKQTLQIMIKRRAEDIVKDAHGRDYIGVDKDNGTQYNIINAYQRFLALTNKLLNNGGESGE
ncbi:MAG: type I-E CRISPR-associated protein Cse1/CasA [Lachnospiraceae bacterium]|jgi:CRISPR system Cascade subunit CasA|nr:type I-E CRISPR-associated protein Cse1/CasA [Lachnospiraceae bacterium]